MNWKAMSLLGLCLSQNPLWAADDAAIPLENQQENLRPTIQAFDARAQRLVKALHEGSFDDVKDLFFPEPAFLQLKAIARPGDYHRQLLTWFQNDFKREQDRLKNRGSIRFKALKGGSCKWKAVNTEANKIAYWSCYRKKIEVELGDKVEVIEVKALINWGPDWYITHLGPIPKG